MNVSWRWVAVGIYLVLLLASHAYRATRPEPPLPDHDRQIELLAFGGDGERSIRLAYDEAGPVGAEPLGTVVLIHGSPGNKENFETVIPVLAQRYRVIVPDLPGFGRSTESIPDYSVVAHADYVQRLLVELDVERAHIVGYSMGGGVALELSRRWGERHFDSLVLLAAIGVQELELLGDYRLNHFVHGAQLGGLWFVHEAIPHFGQLDGMLLNVAYARNFYDTDQRPLREILRGLDVPTLVLHGDKDFLVPPMAAVEHHRLVPHSELQMHPTDHFLVFQEGAWTGERLLDWCDRVQAGAVPDRSHAGAERVSRAAEPFDPRSIPAATGMALFVVCLLLIAATLVSEDLTCIGAGLLVSQGRLDFGWAVAACCVGIFVGDMLMFLAGRWIGRPALSQIPLRWWISEAQVRLASGWFKRRGAIVILASRFTPGARLPTYFAAGSLRTSVLSFAFYFLLAVLAWTPAVIGLTLWLGDRVLGGFEWFERHGLWAVAVLALWMFLLVKFAIPALTRRGRRGLVGLWRRWTRWEFWPGWLFYIPVVLYWLSLGLRYRHWFLFTAANPAIPDSGFVLESKREILDGLTADPANKAWVACYRALSGDLPTAERVAVCETFMRERGCTWPVVLKPDAGQRGSGVAIVRDRQALEAYLDQAPYDTLIQEYVSGVEFGLFYVRRPDEQRGRIFSVTEKQMPVVVGDGERTLEELILDDPRAVAMADHYVRVQGARVLDVPAAGQSVQLVELGTHCRGAIFLDGHNRLTEALEERVDEISRRFRGFYFGRYDVRARDIDALRRGEIKILELNGVSSEATHIYDPSISLRQAYRTLFGQWRLAFEIGEANRAAGTRPVGLARLLQALAAYRRLSRTHV